MNRHIYRHRQGLDIIQLENQKLLERRLYQVIKLSESENMEEEIIEKMVNELIAHGKDANQIRQISLISKLLGQSLGLGETYCDVLEKAAKVYDVGNIAIKSEVYEKEDKLTFEEFESVKKHTHLGHEILSKLGFESTDLAAIISIEHHEWWNGGGYPQRLMRDNINIASGIVAVADSVGALFRNRPGRHIWNYESILEYVKKRSGVQFDPSVVDVFLINKDAIYEILNNDLETVPSNWYA